MFSHDRPKRLADKSSAARRGRKVTYIPDDPLLSAAEAAQERGQGKSTFWRDLKQGRVPPPIYVNVRCPRWRRSIIRAGVEACRSNQRSKKTAGKA